ncbi:OmpA family protein [Actinomycetospora sp. CA-084318]|uniref:OmpA family protein n=1 Tax=Actinomycetospora sp. CA-084318 TaxID=3239892 RepID=UPI003D98F723
MTIPQVLCPLCQLAPDHSGRCPDCKQNLAPLAYLDAQATVHYNRALDLAAEGDDAGAVRAAEASVAEDGRFADAWVVLGKLYRKAGRTADARRAWESALAADSAHRGAQDALAALGPDGARDRAGTGRQWLVGIVLLLLAALIALVVWLLLRPAPAPAAPGAGLFTVSQRAGTIALTGSVPDDRTLQPFRDAARTAVGNRSLDTSALVIDGGSGASPPVDGPTVGSVVGTLVGAPRADTTVVLTPTRAIVSGTFPDDGVRQLVIGGLRDDLPGREVLDQAGLGSPSAPSAGSVDPASTDGAVQAVQQAAPIRFGPSDATLTPAAAATVQAIASIVRGQDVTLEVEGFTAPIGPPDGAQAISANRAGAVRDALVASGVPADHVRVQALGDSQSLPSPEASRRATVRVAPVR